MVKISYWEKGLSIKIKYFVGRYLSGHIEGTLSPCGVSEEDYSKVDPDHPNNRHSVRIYRGKIEGREERMSPLIGKLRDDVNEACDASAERRRIFRKAILRDRINRVD